MEPATIVLGGTCIVLIGISTYLVIKNIKLNNRIKYAVSEIKQQQKPYPRRKKPGKVYKFIIDEETRYYSKGFGWLNKKETE
jgi:hypothetical protein